MKNLIKRILPITMAFAVAVPTSALATVTNYDPISKEEIDGSTSRETEVRYSLPSTYFVTIPKTIILDGKTKSSNYAVQVKGDIASDEEITVAHQDELTDIEGINFYMYEQSGNVKKEPVQADVVQNETIWSRAEVCEIDGTVKNGKVEAPGISAGDWKGVFTFLINIRDAHEHNIVDGVCTICGGKEDAHKHSYTETIVKQPTCTEAGEKTLTCECGDTKTEMIDALGHNYVEGTCENCGEAFVCTEHTFADGQCTKCGFWKTGVYKNGTYLRTIAEQGFTNKFELTDSGGAAESRNYYATAAGSGYNAFSGSSNAFTVVFTPDFTGRYYLNQNVNHIYIGNNDLRGASGIKKLVISTNDVNTNINMGTQYSRDDWGYCVANCSYLEEVILDAKGNINLSQYTFAQDTKLKTVDIKCTGTLTIKQYAFSGDTALQSINLPDNVVLSGSNQFYNVPSSCVITYRGNAYSPSTIASAIKG